MIESKGNGAVNSQPTLQRITEDDIATVLGGLTKPYGRRPATIEPKELQAILECGQSSCYTYITTGRIPAHYFLTSALRAFDLGDAALIEICLPAGYTLTPIGERKPDGNVVRDECAIVGNTDKAREAYEKKDKKKARAALADAKKALAEFEAEVSAMK